MSATKFSKDGKSEWTNENTVSQAIENITESFDYNSGFVNEEKHIMFIKGRNAVSVSKQVDTIVKAINDGQLATYRAFSVNPFYADQSMDINPSTGAELNRYSQVRLCVVSKLAELNRQYVVNETVEAEVEAEA